MHDACATSRRESSGTQLGQNEAAGSNRRILPPASPVPVACVGVGASAFPWSALLAPDLTARRLAGKTPCDVMRLDVIYCSFSSRAVRSYAMLVSVSSVCVFPMVPNLEFAPVLMDSLF